MSIFLSLEYSRQTRIIFKILLNLQKQIGWNIYMQKNFAELFVVVKL